MLETINKLFQIMAFCVLTGFCTGIGFAIAWKLVGNSKHSITCKMPDNVFLLGKGATSDGTVEINGGKNG